MHSWEEIEDFYTQLQEGLPRWRKTRPKTP